MDLKPDLNDEQNSFLPEEYVAQRAENRASIITLVLFAVVMFGVVGAFLITNERWASVRTRQEAVGEAYAAEAVKIEQLKSLEAQRTQLVGKAEITTALLERVPRSVLLAELTTRLPATVTLTLIELDGKRLVKKSADPKKKGRQVRSLSKGAKVGAKNQLASDERPEIEAPQFSFKLTLEGVCPTNSPITDYMSALNDLPLLSHVELEFIQQTQIDHVDLRRFKITSVLRRDADASMLDLVRASHDDDATIEDGSSDDDSFFDDNELADATDQGEEH